MRTIFILYVCTHTRITISFYLTRLSFLSSLIKKKNLGDEKNGTFHLYSHIELSFTHNYCHFQLRILKKKNYYLKYLLKKTMTYLLHMHFFDVVIKMVGVLRSNNNHTKIHWYTYTDLITHTLISNCDDIININFFLVLALLYRY